jgi:DnaA-homolog protein
MGLSREDAAIPGTPDGVMRQVPLDFEPDRSWRLETFAASHIPEWPHLRELLLLPSGQQPVYLWGPTGSGKTHLLQAAQAEAQANGIRVAGFDLRSPLPWNPWEFGEIGLLVLDDCDRFDAGRQHAAFVLFVEAVTRGVPVLAAGALPPVDLPIRDDLRSRLGWGLVFRLSPPGEDDVRRLLRCEADRRGMFLSDDVMDFLLRRLARDLGHLMAVLDRLDRYALAAQRSVTVPLLRQMLAEEVGA